MDHNLLKFLAGVAGLAAEQLDAAARPPTATPPPGPPPATPEGAPAPRADVEGPRCSLCAAEGETLVAGPCGAACGRCLAHAMPLVLEQLQQSEYALRAQNSLYEVALAELDQRTRGLHERVEVLVRGAEALRAERDRIVAERDAARAMRASAGVRQIVVVSGSTRSRIELCADEATVGRILRFWAREFPGATIAVDDEVQDVGHLEQQARSEFWRESFEEVCRLVGAGLDAQAGVAPACGDVLQHHSDPIFDCEPVMPPAVAALPAATPAVTGPSPVARREAADNEVDGLTALIAHVHDEQARPRAPLGEYTPPYHPPRSRHAARTGRKRIGEWLETLHSHGLELASGLRTAHDIAQSLNPGSEVAEKARLSPQTLIKFKTEPGGRTVETLARIAVAMGCSDLFALKRLEEEAPTMPPPTSPGSSACLPARFIEIVHNGAALNGARAAEAEHHAAGFELPRVASTV